MAFSRTSINIRLQNTILRASCETRNGPRRESLLDLDDYIGTEDGRFDLFGSKFSESASEIRFRPDNVTLYANLQNKRGDRVSASLDLDVCVENVNGILVFRQPSKQLLQSCTKLRLEGSVLIGLCLGADGQRHESSVDLNRHYGNRDGSFVPGGGHFYLTAHNTSLAVTPDGKVLLRADLRNYTGAYVPAEIDVSIYVVNKRGKLAFEYLATTHL